MNRTDNTLNLHPAQLELYYDQILDMDSPHYNVGGYVHLQGEMDKEKIIEAIKRVQNAYDIHKISFDFEGDEPRCFFNENHHNVSVKEIDLSSEKQPFQCAEKWMRQQYNTAFSFQQQPFYEFAILHLGPLENILYCKYHHILSDAFGFSIVLNALAQEYTNLLNGDTQNDTQYNSYQDEILKSNEYLRSEKYQKDRAYWMEKYQTLPSPVLSKKYQDNEAEASNTLVYDISEERRAKYEALNEELGTSLQQLTLAALQIYYGKLIPENEVSFGTFVYKRRREQWKTLGMFAGIIPFKAAYDEDITVKTLVKNIKSQLFKNYRHQNYPVSHLNRDLKMMTNANTQLFEVIVNYVLLDFDLKFGTLKSTTCDLLSDYEKSPLRFWWRDYGKQQNLQLRVDLSLSYVKTWEVELMIERVFCILDHLIDHLDKPLKEVNILTDQEEELLLNGFNDTEKVYDTAGKTVVDLFEEQVQKTPDKVAIVYENESLTYQQLDEKANQLARHLRTKGVKEETLVALCLDRSLNMMIALLGIIKAGGAYVPIEPVYPKDRANYIIDNAQAEYLVCTKDCRNTFADNDNLAIILIDEEWPEIAKQPTTKLPVDIRSEHLFYVIYTSGSTGKPKGVMNQYSGVVNYLTWLQDHYQLDPEVDSILQTTTYCFDVSVWELFWPVITGVKLVFARPGGQKDNEYLKKAVERYQISTIHFVPSMLEVFLPGVEEGVCSSIRKVICSGEALLPNHVEEFRKHLPNAQLINLYGPTEAAVDVTFWDVPAIDVPVDKVPIGKPLANTQLYVLSKQGQLCPIGVQGELYVGGIQVARGYINKPELTADRFVQDIFRPDSTTTLYKTGDLAMWLPDGNIEFMGRIDNQVKIRGNRVELGEIESAIHDISGVTQCAVLAQPDPNGSLRLVAYIVTSEQFDKAAIQESLKEKLPEYMVPSIMMHLDELPLLGNGKTNRKALPNPDASSLLSSDFVAPQNKIQETFVDTWKALLKVEKIGIHDNFFELGGNSIVAIQLIRKLKQQGFNLTPKDVFDRPTVAMLTSILEEGNTVEKISEAIDLFPAQERFFNEEYESGIYDNYAALFAIDKNIEKDTIEKSVQALVAQQEALQFVFRKEEEKWRLYPSSEISNLIVEDLSTTASEQTPNAIIACAEQYQTNHQIENSPVLNVVLMITPNVKNRLLITVARPAIDQQSWSILQGQFDRILNASQTGKTLEVNAAKISYQASLSVLQEHRLKKDRFNEQSFWRTIAENNQAIAKENKLSEGLKTHRLCLNENNTDLLLTTANKAYATTSNDLLIAAWVKTMIARSNSESVTISLETKVREVLSDKVDLSQTIGCFNTSYSTKLTLDQNASLGDQIKSVKEQLRRGLSDDYKYNLLSYLYPLEEDKNNDQRFLYKYLNTQSCNEYQVLEVAEEVMMQDKNYLESLSCEMIIDTSLVNNELNISWSYLSSLYTQQVIDEIAQQYLNNLKELTVHCLEQEETQYTPSDFQLPLSVGYKELDEFFNVEEEGIRRRDKYVDVYELSATQEGMLFHSLYNEESNVYTEQLSFNLQGAIDVDALAKSWEFIIAKHDVLRTKFLYGGLNVPVQVVEKTGNTPLEIIDYSSLDSSTKATQYQHLLKHDYEKGFSFDGENLMRLALVKLDATNYTMVWTFHHILLDGWSIAVLLGELLQTYEAYATGEQPELRTVDHFVDYIKYVKSIDTYKGEQFWKTYLQDCSSPTLLPFVEATADRNKGGKETKVTTLHLKEKLLNQLEEFARKNHLTVNTVVQGVWGFLLAKYTNSDQAMYGVTVAGRPAEIEQSEIGVGLYMNTIPLRTKIQEEQSVVDWLTEIQESHTKARAFQYIGLNDIQNWTGINGALFDSILVFDNYPMDGLFSKEWSLKVNDFEVKAKNNFLLSLDVVLHDGLTVNFSYYDDLLDTTYVEMIKNHFEQVLSEMVQVEKTNLSEIELLSSLDYIQLVSTFNNTAQSYDKNQTLVDLLERQVSKTPNHIALVSEGKQWTYRELDIETNRLANYLKTTYVLEPNDLVGVMMERSAWAVISILGILKAGAAYVPIDNEYPNERKQFIIEDTQVKALIIQSENLFDVIDFDVNVFSIDIQLDELGDGTVLEKSPIAATDLAYVIYTSGSTGQPKGVMIQHDNLNNYLLHGQRVYGKDLAHLSFPLFTSMSFDLTQTSILLTLTTGGTLFVERSNDLDAVLNKVMSNEQVNILKLTPAHISLLGNIEQTHITKAIVGGEKLERHHVKGLKELNRNITVFNEYGPTEATIGCTVLEINTLEAEISIGQPICNTQIFITDTSQNLLPVGVVGELCVAGDGVARGYLNRTELTNRKFVENPYSPSPAAKMYRTGDLARWMPDGSLEYLGRMDDQVKVNGYRIELGEIESTLNEASTINQSVVLVLVDKRGNKRLVAYVVPQGNFDDHQIKMFVGEKLPAYMIPSTIIELAEIPLTINGKVDKKALPNPEVSRAGKTKFVAPENETQQQMALIWEHLLSVEKVGIHDDFFDLGGDSIITIQLVGRLRRLGFQVSPKEVFEYPTIATLYDAVKDNLQELNAEQGQLEGTAGLLPIQHWFFEKGNVDILNHYNQSVILEVDKNLKGTFVEQSIQAIVDHHDALRFVYKKEKDNWIQTYGECNFKLDIEDLSDCSAEDESAAITAVCDRYQCTMDIEKGELIRAVLIQTPSTKNRLFVSIHHIATDGVSWRILLDHLNQALTALDEGVPIYFGSKSTSYRSWGEQMDQYALADKVMDELGFWETLADIGPQFPVDFKAQSTTMKEVKEHTVTLEPAFTKSLLQEVNQAYDTEINDVLLSALAKTIRNEISDDKMLIGLDGHGREDLFDKTDVSSTVGWFTNLFPVRLEVAQEASLTNLITSVKNQVHAIPQKGMGYGLLRYQHPSKEIRQRLEGINWEVEFNYLGQMDNVVDGNNWFGIAKESVGKGKGDLYPYSNKFSIESYVTNGQLTLCWSYSSLLFKEATIQDLAQQYLSNLKMIINHCLEKTGKSLVQTIALEQHPV